MKSASLELKRLLMRSRALNYRKTGRRSRASVTSLSPLPSPCRYRLYFAAIRSSGTFKDDPGRPGEC